MSVHEKPATAPFLLPVVLIVSGGLLLLSGNVFGVMAGFLLGLVGVSLLGVRILYALFRAIRSSR